MALTLKIFSRAEGAARFMGQHELEGARVTIGRSVECTLQLPDPERKLSRVHVEFLGTGDGYRLRVASTHSSVVVNGRDYPPGSEVTLRVGDALSMDVYNLDIVSVGASYLEPMQAAPVDAPAMHREEVVLPPPTEIVGSAGTSMGLTKSLGLCAAVMVAVVAIVLAWPTHESNLKDLAYSPKAGGDVHFKGLYRGEPFTLVRKPAKGGAGAWDLYSGPPKDRLRASWVDKKGMTEIVAMDTGFRLAFGYSEGKHFEYRLYGPDRGFLSGSVLYRDKDRWLHGMLKAEAFAGYGGLVRVTDITERVARMKVSSHIDRGERLASTFSAGLISAARADTEIEDLYGYKEPTSKVFLKAGYDAWVAGSQVFSEAHQEKAPGGAAAKALLGSPGDQKKYLMGEGSGIIEEEFDKQKNRFLGKFVDVVAKHSDTVKEVRDAFQEDSNGKESSHASKEKDAWYPFGIGRGGFVQGKVASLWNAGTKVVKKVAKFAGLIEDPPDDYNVADGPTMPQEPRDPNYIGPMAREKAFTKAQEAAGRCSRAKDFECAEEAIADLRKYARHGDFIEESRDAEVIKRVTDEVAAERREVTLAALKKEEEARRSLQAEDRKSAEKEAEAKRIATQPTPNISNVATPTARPRETQDPDAARSIEFIEEQEKRRLKAVSDRADLMDKVAAEEDKDKQAALRRRYDAVTRAEEEEQAASRRRFERASEGRRAVAESALAQSRPAQGAPVAQGTGSGCLGQLAGAWSHAVGGTWTFSGNQATLVLNSTNYGPRAQQITVLVLSSCENFTMTYKIVRAALINTIDPSFAYDKTPANAPGAPNWSKVNSQAYSISGNGLRFGNYTYAKR